MAEIAPNLFKIVQKQTMNRRTHCHTHQVYEPTSINAQTRENPLKTEYRPTYQKRWLTCNERGSVNPLCGLANLPRWSHDLHHLMHISKIYTLDSKVV
jgi:hypothetical protein